MYAGSHSMWSAWHDFALRIPVEWLVRTLVLTSMILQLFLVVLGARRYLSSSRILRLIVWGAYISADAVAISALGTMMHNARSQIYGIWAPVLLMHLGGPDAITAYSMADNELWLRHGFNMVYQVSVALYVIYASTLKGYALASAILLLFVGSIKYAERTFALRFSSYSRIVMSSMSISKYMEKENVVEKCGYVVMGEYQLQRMIEQEPPSSSLEGRGIRAESEASSLRRKGTEAESEARKGIEAESEANSLKRRGVVTVEDVKRANNIEERDSNICLSHALFKMYKRRFGSLYFVEGDWPKTRTFWVDLGAEKAFRIVEMELKFMYDALFSKYSGTAFSKWGMVVRFLNTILMGAAGFLILRESYSQSRHAQATVTYVVISVALVVEVFQLWRVIVSDWTRVRLVCARVVLSRPPESPIKWCRLKVIEMTMFVLGKVGNVVGEDRYWSNGIPQHCLIETWLDRCPLMWKVAGLFPKPDSFIISWYIKLRHIHKVPVQEDLKVFIFDILKRMCSRSHSSERFRYHVYNFEESLFEREPEITSVLKLHGDLEEAILMWHIATTLLDREREFLGQDENKSVRLSRILSRYCAYLLLSHPNILPLHPSMAGIAYMQLVKRLLNTLTLDRILDKDPTNLLRYEEEDVLGSGANLARQPLRKGEQGLELLAEYWGSLVIYMAVYNKSTLHAECVAAGGEFLSQVWVLLGHMGCGEQSDSAVRKKIERSMKGEGKEWEERMERERRKFEERMEQERMEQESKERENIGL